MSLSVLAFSQTTAWYPFSGNAEDISGNNLHGIVSYPTLTTDQANKENSAFLFNGFSDVITAPAIPALEQSNNRTVCAWVRSTAKDKEAGIAGYIEPIIGHDGYLLMQRYTNKFFMLEDNYNDGAGAWDGPASDSAYGGDDLWHHLAGVRRNDTTYLYVDGKKQSSFTTRTATVFPGSIIVIGSARPYWYGTDLQCFSGTIDDVRFYPYALTDPELSALANNVLITNNPQITAADSSQQIINKKKPHPVHPVHPIHPEHPEQAQNDLQMHQSQETNVLYRVVKPQQSQTVTARAFFSLNGQLVRKPQTFRAAYINPKTNLDK
jgi:hypothetical protein